MPENLEIRKRYQDALDAIVEDARKDASVIAAISYGSLVNGIVWEKSDIDLVLITKDQKNPNTYIWLMEEEISAHVSVMTRNEFKRSQQIALQGSFEHHIMTTSHIIFSKDPTLNEFISDMKKIGARDMQINMMSYILMVIAYLEKAEKHLYVMNDIAQSYLFISRLLDSLASIAVMLNNQIPGREAVEQAMEFEPGLFKNIYMDVITGSLTPEKCENIIFKIRNYLEQNTKIIFEPVIDYLKKENEVRSVTDLARFLDNIKRSYIWEMGAAIIGDWLAEQGFCERVPSPIRLTLRSHEDSNEIGYLYTGE